MKLERGVRTDRGRRVLHALALVALCAAATGCGPTTSAASAPKIVKRSPSQVACLVNAVIEDGENGDHQVRPREDRDGYIYTFSDEGKTRIQPPKGADFTMEPGGAAGSAYSLRVRGKIADKGIAHGGVGLNFVDPRAQYDASKYLGVSFVARHGKSSVASIRLKVPDANTDPDGNVCTECFNDFGADVELTEDWQEYVVPFDYMKQMPGWGAPRPALVDTSRIYSLQFQVNELGAAFDIWIDDVSFVGCDTH